MSCTIDNEFLPQFIAAHESVPGTSRHFAAAQQLGRFRREADINWQTKPAGSVANDPKRISHS
jgi:hypothetical protein